MMMEPRDALFGRTLKMFSPPICQAIRYTLFLFPLPPLLFAEIRLQTEPVMSLHLPSYQLFWRCSLIPQLFDLVLGQRNTFGMFGIVYELVRLSNVV